MSNQDWQAPAHEVGLQRPPKTDTDIYAEEIAGQYSQWHRPEWSDDSQMASTGLPALSTEDLTRPEPETEKEQKPKLVPVTTAREVVLGKTIAWRTLALGAAAVLTIGGVGGFVGGWAGKTYYSQSNMTELVPLEGRPGDGELTQVGAVAEKIRPTVVSIHAGTGEVSAVGSGFVFDDKGHILTNNHVVSAVADDPTAEVRVDFESAGEKKSVGGRIVGRDQQTDLAVVEVTDVRGMTVAQLANSNEVRVGDGVVAMGSPQGLGGTVTSGIVSALNRPIRLKGEGTDTDGFADAIQTDASINPGNSGGPLVDMHGAVIGINTIIFTNSGGSQGLGFAIPINAAVAVAQQIIQGEPVQHPSIGVTARSVSNDRLTGAELATVPSDSVAASVGLLEGDVVTAVGGRSVESADELTVALWTSGSGHEVELTVIRDGQRMTIPVTPK